LTPSARSGNLIAGDGTKNGLPAPNKELAINRKHHLTGKAPYKFVWHSHAETDDFFLVLEGNLTIQLRDGEVRLGPGDLYVVSRGVEHRPVAEEEAHLLLIEPHGTPNTGDPATAAAKHAI
jgi:mannose-6-phosphate isomerase-like protein (cupin superfamily)